MNGVSERVEKRRAYMRRYMAERFASMTDEERRALNDRDIANRTARVARMTESERETYRLRRAERERLRRAEMTDEQRRHVRSIQNEANKQRLPVLRNSLDYWKARAVFRARARAKSKGWDFDLTADDIEFPDVCPILGVPLRIGTPKKWIDSSPSLDRIDPRRGYVRGNVWVISHRANRIKNDATLDELRTLLRVLESRHP